MAHVVSREASTGSWQRGDRTGQDVQACVQCSAGFQVQICLDFVEFKLEKGSYFFSFPSLIQLFFFL